MGGFTHDDIMGFNERIQMDCYVHSIDLYSNQYPVISFYEDERLIVKVKEPNIKYSIGLAVCSKRYDEFFDIYDRLFNIGFSNMVEKNCDGIYYKIDLDKVKIKKMEKNVVLNNRNFININMMVSGCLSSIMGFISILEDSVSFFEKLYCYYEDGEEVSLMKYPIGTIVSPISDRSKNLLVMDYVYKKDRNGFYLIDYLVSEVSTDNRYNIVKVEKIYTIREGDIKFSRNIIKNSSLN